MAVAIAGSVVAVALPVFIANLHASRLTEPMVGLQQLAGRASALAAGRPPEFAYPPSAPQTPAKVPRGERVQDQPGTWDHPTWRELSFAQDLPHRFTFEFVSENGAEQASFRAVAHGDLDGDGNLSTFEVSGQSLAGQPPLVFALEMHREVE